MKGHLTAAAAVLAAVTGCASAPSIPSGMKAGEFVSYSCEGGKRLAARAAADGTSVRVRFEGGYELDRKADGVYEADGWTLKTAGGSAELTHQGKAVAKGCRPA